MRYLVRGLLVFAAIAFVFSCVKNDCPGGNTVLGEWITRADLATRADEDTYSVRWYWCEAPIAKGAPIPEGKLGPIVNLADGSDYGYGGWVRPLADDVRRFQTWMKWKMTAAKVTDEPVSDPHMWALAAAALFSQDSADAKPLTYWTADKYSRFMDILGTTRIRCYTVGEMQRQLDDWGQCKTPAPNSPVTKSGGSSSSSGSTSGGPTGDWGPN